MAGTLKFYGKVVVVTGAGGGLGREYALQFARRGASLVVNDLGGARDGEGQSNSSADLVVKEIMANGGKAVADYNSVEDGDKIVQTAVDNYGKVDIIVNNAGIIRDRSFVKMTNKDWDLVHNVHLRGSFMVTKAAWPYFRQQNYGKVIFTASAVAMFGNFGQANYSSAKMGLVGLCKTLAVEGAKYNIRCNTVIPTAVSRMTQDLLPPDIQEFLQPKYVAPLVVWLSHDTCVESGQVFEAGAGWVGKYEFRRSKGVNCLDGDKNLSAEAICEKWSEITDMTDNNVLDNIQAQITSIVESAESRHHVNKVSSTYSYTPSDVILYALSVGVSSRQKDYLKFLYENHKDFTVLPTFGINPAVNMVMKRMDEFIPLVDQHVSGLDMDISRLLHGEHYLEIKKPLPTNGTKLKSTLEVCDVLDKGSGALIIMNVKSVDENGDEVLFNQLCCFVTGSGNFEGKRYSDKQIPIIEPPDRQPDAVITEKISDDQSMLYRLNGDFNPLHVDPEFASLSGFKKPILHGLCTFGISVRHILSKCPEKVSSDVKCIKARFSGPAEPGQTISTKMWKENQRVHFEAEIAETGNKVITGAYVDFQDGTKSNVILESTELFKFIRENVQKLPNLTSDNPVVYQWNITKDKEVLSTWIVDLKSASVYLGQYNDGKPDCILSCDDDTFVSIFHGNMDPVKAYTSGLLKIEGNIMLSKKICDLFTVPSKL